MRRFNLDFKNLLSIIVLIIFILNGCNKNVKNSPSIDEWYELNKSKEVALKDIFESVELIPLEFREDRSYPSTISKLSVQDSLIFVADNKDIIYVFEKDGKFISSSEDKRGEGPGEFVIINSFTYDPTNHRIAILTPFKIMEYDESFNYIDEYPIPTLIKSREEQSELLFNNIAFLSDDYILFTNSRDGRSSRFMKFNKETHKTQDEIEYRDKIFGFGSFQNKNFYNIDSRSSIFIPTALSNEIFVYDIKENTLTPIIGYTLGEKGISQEDFDPDKDFTQLAYEFLRNEKEAVVRVLPNNENIVFMTKRGTDPKTFANYVVNRETGDKRKIKMYKDGKMISPMFQDIDSDYVYAVMEKEKLIESPSLLLDKADDLNSIDAESIVVLQYKFNNYPE